MKRVYLHIGRSKTGSTAIQTALSQNRARLFAMGFVYPGTGLDHESAVYALRGDGNHAEEAERCLQCAREAEKNVIISSEGFMMLAPEAVKAWLDGFSVRVIVYVREQAEAFASAYQQDIKGLTDTATFAEYAMRQPVFYDRFANDWAHVFGAENMSVRIYDKRDFWGGDLISDFFSVLGVADATPFQLAKSGGDPNPSIAGALLEAKRRLNASFVGGERDLLELTYRALIELARENPAYRGRIAADPDLIAAIRARHRESNANLAARWLGRDFAFWENPWPDVPEFSEADVEAAMRSLKQRAGRYLDA